MNISVRWLNQYLEPGNVSPKEAEEALTSAGFPIESATELPGGGGDVLLDVEVTSNRGDCLCHVGVAREIAAVTGRRFLAPAIPDAVGTGTGDLARLVRLDNRVPDVCRLFTLRAVRGVKIGPSPAWLADALTSVGQRPINNVVDVTNYVLFELGQPTHAFDLARLKGGAVAVRYATAGEKLTLLDGRTVALNPDELVVADASGAVSLAGIMGGRGTEVTDTTVDVLLEAATWDPLTIRRAARRLQIATDACYRFERTVDPRTIDRASRRAAELLVRVGGPNAKLVSGMIQQGAPERPLTRVTLRPSRCQAILGLDVPTATITTALGAHDISVSAAGADSLECTIPAHRPDLDREIDLIEEVARTINLEKIPILDMLPVRVAAPQLSERAARELAGALTGLGFFETITFSFVSPKHAAPFLPADLESLQLCDERRKADPALRPSILPSLLACRRANQDAGVQADGGVRLYETASIFAQQAQQGSARGKELETRVLAMYADAVTPAASSKGFDARQEAFRLMRGAIESVVRTLGGPRAKVNLVRAAMPFTGLDADASARVELCTPSGERRSIGVCGLLATGVLREYDLETPGVVAELNLADLLALYPPRSLATPLPEFPGIERDISFIVPENTAWGAMEGLVAEASLDRLEGWEFVTTYRGAYRDSAGAEHNLAKTGKKALTVRLRFRDPARTLRHEEVDPQVASLVSLAGSRLGAELRT